MSIYSENSDPDSTHYYIRKAVKQRRDHVFAARQSRQVKRERLALLMALYIGASLLLLNAVAVAMLQSFAFSDARVVTLLAFSVLAAIGVMMFAVTRFRAQAKAREDHRVLEELRFRESEVASPIGPPRTGHTKEELTRQQGREAQDDTSARWTKP